jgi:hypothetical protein
MMIRENRCGFQQGLNAKRVPFFEGMEVIYYICESKPFFAIFMNKISHFLTLLLGRMV